MNSNEELLIKVETLKNILVARATGEQNDNGEYESLRKELVIDYRIKDKFPKFVYTCRTLGEFWGYIQPKYPSYKERRTFLGEEFHEVLSFLENNIIGTPSDISINNAIKSIDSQYVKEAWQKALERRVSDPEGAITSSRTLIESVCKFILDELDVEYDTKLELPKLYRIVAENLNLAPDQHSEEIFKQILGNTLSIVQGLASIRNKLSDAHGKGKTAAKPAPRHAEFAVNLAGTTATFLILTWESKSKD